MAPCPNERRGAPVRDEGSNLPRQGFPEPADGRGLQWPPFCPPWLPLAQLKHERRWMRRLIPAWAPQLPSHGGR